MLGIIVGALGVFLFGTKSGKNLMKILSEEGLEGISKLMQEYNLSDFGQEFEQEEEVEQEPVKHATNSNHQSQSQQEVKEATHSIKEDMQVQEEVEKAPKKRFFKRLRN